MREIIAIIRRKRAAATKAELSRIGGKGYTAFPVLGRGRQRGLRHGQGGEGLMFLPKVLFNVIVGDEEAQEMVEAIIRANQTGEFGDGKIFVIEVAESYRISTGEQAYKVTSDK
ncbi:MAG: P-II family nitrogen regulator [Candidatus Omnitrophota bacterium]|nr:P-II family nitrogen regulator [Candidatus Omnitrophota bacterium]